MLKTFTLKHIAKAIAKLRELGIDGIIIGSTCIDIILERVCEGDIDLFTTSLSPLLEENKIRQIAYTQGWSTGTTELGTPSITMNIDDIDITVELYENIMDFYIPLESLSLCKRSTVVEGVNINYIAPECWVVFKARRGSGKDMMELAILKQMIEEGSLIVDKSLIKKVIDLYEEDKPYIVERLKTLKLL